MSQTAVCGRFAHHREGVGVRQWPRDAGLDSLGTMEQTALATDDTQTDRIEVAPADDLLDDELLVEEISIDGMCGVY